MSSAWEKGSEWSREHMSEDESWAAWKTLEAGATATTAISTLKLAKKIANAATTAEEAAKASAKAEKQWDLKSYESGKKVGDNSKFKQTNVDLSEVEKFISIEEYKLLDKHKQRGVRSFNKKIKEHKEKLEAYKQNPDGYDNKGFLNNVNEGTKKKIINNRIEKLEKEIKKFENEVTRYEDNY